MQSIARKHILQIKPYIPGKPIEEVEREMGLKSVIKLASNENPYGPSPKVLKAMVQAAKTVNRYPDGSCYYLRQELARRLKVSENQLIFGNGSDELIVLATRAFSDYGDEVIIARPSFLIYEIASKVSGATIKFVPLKDFRYDIEGIKNAITPKTKIIFIGNPDNPSGSYITKAQAEDLLKSIRQKILVFFDEAYFEFVDKDDYPDTIKLMKTYKNVITTRTFSKMYGLAGLRVGYGIGDAQVISLLERVREPFNINSVAQAAALACLKDKAYYEKLLRTIKAQRKYVYANLKKMGLSFVESVTNFILIDVRQNSFNVSQALLKKGVIVRDMGFWGLDTYIRVTVGKPQENQRFIRALKEIMK
ncbi:MAG TPA: histidinol-phosphate transaminase [Candidatus Omnitrophota bacterium]|nr:histidinol-phosphate transaminase [Candidatus Omnitrophota bacterium]HPD84038.1 histidinol-phosphate transaminase [Candidatus Omnitrophota bacterium]HRZ02895.1 histidinol-phosphate transaminase [Candidatus Omnitrophota bacterium]